MRKKSSLFTAAQFTPTQWDTADDKVKFAEQFVYFVEHDFQEGHFPKWFYTQLSMTFGHIAHYNQHGFYAEFFNDIKGKIAFLQQTLEAHGFGDPAYTYSDVEKALAAWVRERDLLAKYCQTARILREKEEREQLAILKAKYEPKGV